MAHLDTSNHVLVKECIAYISVPPCQVESTLTIVITLKLNCDSSTARTHVIQDVVEAISRNIESERCWISMYFNPERDNLPVVVFHISGTIRAVSNVRDSTITSVHKDKPKVCSTGNRLWPHNLVI